MICDGLTKAKLEPDLLRSVLRTAQYSLVEEQEVLARKEAERKTRKAQRQQEAAQEVEAQEEPGQEEAKHISESRCAQGP